MAVTLEDISYIANLARIGLETTPAFANIIADDINNILALVEQIQNLDTSDTSPMSYPLQLFSQDLAQPLREDVVSETNVLDAMQQIAPKDVDNIAKSMGYYVVPQVVDTEI